MTNKVDFTLGTLKIEEAVELAETGIEGAPKPQAGIPVELKAQITEQLAELASEQVEQIEMISASRFEPKIATGTELMQSLEAIPEKMAFKIGEAADMVGVKQYVLRYWETEFEMLRPRKSKNNQRIYGRKDVETALMIKKLLYEDRFSIEGARAALRQLKSQVKEEKATRASVRSQGDALDSALNVAEKRLHAIVSDLRRLGELLA